MNFSEPGCAATITTNNNGNTPLDLALSLLTDIPHATTLSDFTRHLAAINAATYLVLLPQENRFDVEFHQKETTRISTGPLGDAVLEATKLLFFNTFRLDSINAGDGNARAQNRAIYEATGCMLRDLAAEEERYVENMARLLGDMKARWKRDLEETGSWHHTARTMGISGIASARALADFVANSGATTTITTTAPNYLDTKNHINNNHTNKHTNKHIKNRTKATTTTHNNKSNHLAEIARYWRKWTGTGTREASLYEEVWCYVAERALVQE